MGKLWLLTKHIVKAQSRIPTADSQVKREITFECVCQKMLSEILWFYYKSKCDHFRSSCFQMLYKIGVFKNLQNF